MRSLIFIFIIINIIIYSFGVEFDNRGEISYYNALGFSSDKNININNTRLEFESWMYGYNNSAFISFYSENNNSEKNVQLKEAFITIENPNFELRAGKQIIIWGQADGLTVTDVLCPKDNTLFLARDFDDSRIPVDGLRFKKASGYENYEFVFIPVMQAPIFPESDSPWNTNSQLLNSPDIIYQGIENPEEKLKNSEYAFRYSKYGMGFDYSFSFIDHFDNSIFYKNIKTVNGLKKLNVSNQFKRVKILGGEFSKSVSGNVLRGECAYYFNKYFNHKSLWDTNIFEKDLFIFMLGLDMDLGNSKSITLQIKNDHIFDHVEEMSQKENTSILTVNYKQKYQNDTLEWNTMLYSGLNYNDGFLRTEYVCSIDDQTKVKAGIDIFYGDKGNFAMYDGNDEFFCEYSFYF